MAFDDFFCNCNILPSNGMEAMILTLRVLIDDILETKYSDEVLSKLLVVSGMVLSREIPQDTCYTFDIVNSTIIPDVQDYTFIVLNSHKAAIMLLTSELKSIGTQSIKIVDGPSSIDLTNISTNMTSLLKTLRDQYNKMLMDITMNSSGFGRAVITPTTVEYISPAEFS
jgi:hypothetical protein